MPILQNKLVIKSIEALHDEALALMSDSANNCDVSAPPNVLHSTTPLQKVPIKSPETTSANAPSESAGDHDIMARIDRLLEKLNEDVDVEVAPQAEEKRQSNPGNMTNNAGYTTNPDKINKNNPANPENPALSDAVDHANKNAIRNTDASEMTKNAANKPSSATVDNTDDDADDEIFSNDQSEKATPPDQTKALADIAEAIYQARQQAFDNDVFDARPNNAAPLDMDALSAAVADKVRRTISEVIMAELPQMVRSAVGETIRALPAVAHSQSKSNNGNSPTAKSVTPRKTSAASKAAQTGTKKAGAKKATTKKTIEKKATHKKLSTKKSKVKKAATKKNRRIDITHKNIIDV